MSPDARISTPSRPLSAAGVRASGKTSKYLEKLNNITELRRQVSRLTARARPVLPFGIEAVDGCLPGGGLPLGRLHEVGGDGLEAEVAAAGGGFAAGLLARLSERGMVAWAMRRADLHPPGLAAFGLHPDRLLLLRCPDDAEVLAAMDTLLRSAGVAAVLGEVEQLSLTAGRRLQLACEAGGTTAFALRRSPWGRKHKREASAATTGWRVRPLPSRPEEPGVGRPLWQVDLTLCRGGREGSWTMEACDASGHVRVVAELGHPASEARVA